MNVINIRAPRWHRKDVLVASWKVGSWNQITIEHVNKQGVRSYPEPFIVSGEWLKKYPLIDHPHGKMIEIPLADLIEETHGRQPQESQTHLTFKGPGFLSETRGDETPPTV